MSENKSQTPAQNTPENSEKKKVSLFALIVVLVVAVIVMVALFVRSNNLSSQLDEVNGQLAASNTELQQTIADKETAQAELTTAQNDLREAQLVLEESTAKVAELEAQLVVLNDENEVNKAQVETLTAELDTAKANQAAAQGYLDNVSAQLDELMQNLGLAQSALNGEATEEPAAEPDATEEPAAEGRVLTTTITSMLPDEYTLDVELHLDANNVVTELKLTLENEIEGLTQEMLDAFAEQFVGKQLPVVLHADADETTAEEQIVEGMENQLENSRGIVEMLNKLAEQ